MPGKMSGKMPTRKNSIWTRFSQCLFKMNVVMVVTKQLPYDNYIVSDGHSWVRDFKPTNTPRVFHIETTWEQLFPRRFNVEDTWCVCRETFHEAFVHKYLPLSKDCSIEKDGLGGCIEKRTCFKNLYGQNLLI